MVVVRTREPGNANSKAGTFFTSRSGGYPIKSNGKGEKININKPRILNQRIIGLKRPGSGADESSSR